MAMLAEVAVQTRASKGAMSPLRMGQSERAASWPRLHGETVCDQAQYQNAYVFIV